MLETLLQKHKHTCNCTSLNAMLLSFNTVLTHNVCEKKYFDFYIVTVLKVKQTIQILSGK